MNFFKAQVKFFSYIPFRLKKRLFLLVPLLSVAGFLEVVSLAILIPLVGGMLEPHKSIFIIDFLGLSGFGIKNKLFIIFVIFMIFIFIKGIFIFLITKFTFFTSAHIKVFFQNELFLKYLKKDYVSHLNSNSANYLRNITTECNQLEGRFIMPSLTLLAELLPVFFILIFLVYLNPLGIVVSSIIFVLTGYCITVLTSKLLKKYGKDQITSDGMQIKTAKEAFSALKEIDLYKKGNSISKIYNGYTEKSALLISNSLALGQIPKFVLEIVGLLTIALIAFISFSKGSTANEVLVELAVFMGAIIKLLPSMNRIVMNMQSLAHAKPAIENIMAELNDVTEKNSDQDKKALSNFTELRFSNLSFKYPNSDEFIVDCANLNIKRGEIIGIKGESGSGKSTLINLVLGLFKATEGQVLINGLDINTCKSSWHDKIAYVPQDVVLFDDTLKNNITFYQDDVASSALEEILNKLKLENFIERLDERIGEGGSSLSGGQKQRIGIARGLARKPEFIIFDEATSALDYETELEINKLIKEISKTVTVFVIAHKSTALAVCDEVYTIKNKKLVKWKI